MKEIWKDIEGYEGYYQVSNKARVRSLDREVRHSVNSTQTVKGMILKQQVNVDGYMVISLWKKSKLKGLRVHRLMAQAFIPNPHNKLEINHKNGVKDDNRMENLEWSTSTENNRHRVNVLGYKPANSMPIRCISLDIEADSFTKMQRILHKKGVAPKYSATTLFNKLERQGNPFCYKGLMFETID